MRLWLDSLSGKRFQLCNDIVVSTAEKGPFVEQEKNGRKNQFGNGNDSSNYTSYATSTSTCTIVKQCSGNDSER